ncbi:hypothetical protein [Butyricicoccus sp.]|uniref:hypothetical protein n=1 Tax=Butyricicoccus sp. TaxID=2049021 RepID=UPI003734F5AF
MDKVLYVDCTQSDGPIAIFASDAQVVYAGVTVSGMPERDREAARIYEARLGILFLFAGDAPELPFYTVPQVEVFARDGDGWLATVWQPTDGEDDAPVCYIDADRQCWRAADSFRQLLDRPDWKRQLAPMKGIAVYASRKDAARELGIRVIRHPEDLDG